MKKHWKTILVGVAFVLLFAIHIRDTIAINNMEDWLATNYSYQSKLNQGTASVNDVEDLNRRVTGLERDMTKLDDAVTTILNYLNR
jgi:hypothetical protein